jgi:hypothetical protein
VRNGICAVTSGAGEGAERGHEVLGVVECRAELGTPQEKGGEGMAGGWAGWRVEEVCMRSLV